MKIKADEIKPILGFVFAQEADTEVAVGGLDITQDEQNILLLETVEPPKLGSPIGDGKYLPVQVRPGTVFLIPRKFCMTYHVGGETYYFCNQKDMIAIIESVE
jgi:co-chaperonin GroES (HSP10)